MSNKPEIKHIEVVLFRDMDNQHIRVTRTFLNNNVELITNWQNGGTIENFSQGEGKWTATIGPMGLPARLDFNLHYRIKPLEVKVGSVWLYGKTPRVVLRGNTLDDGYFLLGDVSALDITTEVTISKFTELEKLADSLKEYYISRN